VGTSPSRLAAEADGTLLEQPLAARRQTTREGSWMDQLLRLDVAGDILSLPKLRLRVVAGGGWQLVVGVW